MAENTEQREQSSKDAVLARLQKRYPETEFGDDEAMYDQIGKDYDDYESRLSEYETKNQDMIDKLNKNPEAASLLVNIIDGKDPLVMLVELFGDDIGEMLKDPERMDKVAEAHKKYLERVAKNSEMKKNWEEGAQKTVENKLSLMKEKNISEDDMNKAMEWLIDTMDKMVVSGEVSKEAILLALKAVKHDEELEQARREGEVRGRNTKIQEQLRSAQQGDNIPNLGGRGSEGEGGEEGALGRIAPNGKDIFERGGMTVLSRGRKR